MPAPSVALVVPGSLATRTGGYEYDRQIVSGLQQAGWTVVVHELDAGFPFPSAAAIERATATVAAIPDGSLVLFDGLAFGALPQIAEREGARLRLVALVHHPLAAETGVDAATAAILHASERRALATARLVVVTSEATARALGDYDVDRSRIAVVRPGTDTAPLARGSRGPESDAGVPFHLLTVATLVPRKGHDVLLDALHSLRGRPWRLTCAGSQTLDSETARRLRAQAERLGLSDRVHFPGELEGLALAEAFDRADLFVLPTRYEGYGMAVAEAVARGLPVVSTPTGGIPELVGDDSGILVPADDSDALTRALDAFMTDSALRRLLTSGAQARRRGLPTWSDAVAGMAAALVRASR